jgi:hypothetical protein
MRDSLTVYLLIALAALVLLIIAMVAYGHAGMDAASRAVVHYSSTRFL